MNDRPLEPVMQKVFVAQHNPEAHFLCGLLDASGIEAEVRGEALFTTIGGAPTIPGVSPEVWVANADQVPQAREIIHRYVKGMASAGSEGPAWTCSGCGEVHEAQFTACWSCGAAQPGTESA